MDSAVQVFGIHKYHAFCVLGNSLSWRNSVADAVLIDQTIMFGASVQGNFLIF